MAPDRILAAAEGLRAEAASLHDDMIRFKRSQAVKTWLLGAAVVAVFLVGLIVWIDDNRDDHVACVQRLESRHAIREAFGRLPDIGEKFLPEGDPLLIELREADRALRVSLPLTGCS